MATVRPVHRLGIALGALFAVVAAVAGLLYGPQIVSYVTHIRGSATSTRPLTPFPVDARPELRVAVAGDVGDGGSREYRTAEAIATAAGERPYEYLFLLGDSAYPDGDPSELEEKVFLPFAPVLSRGTELLAILGNHDVKQGKGLELIQALGMPRRWWSMQEGDVLFVGLDSTRVDSEAQRRWLAATLEETTARWKIVALHHPPYSGGYQGSSLDARQAFSPIFERFGVQLVLSGHEHDYQRTVPIRGVTYVITGGAADTRRSGRESFTEVAVSWHHFVELDVFDDRLVVRAINQSGRLFDEVTLRPTGS